ncbi:MAG: nitroreductase family protein [Parvibaculaceae bacterium]
MRVSEAVRSRLSCRAFRPDPVPEATVRAILEGARQAPSGGNLQPWHTYVLTGAPLKELVAEVAGRLGTEPRGEGRSIRSTRTR